VVLIEVLSVFNGFQKELRTCILGVASHAEISQFNTRLCIWLKFCIAAFQLLECANGKSTVWGKHQTFL